MNTSDMLRAIDILAPVPLREAGPRVRADLPGGPRHLVLDAGTTANRINGQLWTGGAITTGQDVQRLGGAGITADIDCRLEHDDASLVARYSHLPQTPKALTTHPAIEYLWDGVPDDGAPKPVSWFAGAWTFAKPVLDRGGVLLVHCAAGHHRGPSMAYFLLCAYWGMSPEAAAGLIHERRPEATLIYRPDADAALAQLGLSGPNQETAEMPRVESAQPETLSEAAVVGLMPSELRWLSQFASR